MLRATQFFRSLRVPIVQAPMAGGINTPAFVAEVIKAGCVGSFGFAYTSPSGIASDLRATRALASGPINANFFIFGDPPEVTTSLYSEALKALQEMSFASDVTFPTEVTPVPSLEQSLEPIWQVRPALLTFHFGIPSAAIIEKAQNLGILVGCTTTSREDAIAIEAAGCDFIVAQGIEAGGHRGTFTPDAHGDARLPLSELVQSIKQDAAVSLPVVGSGGIMNGGDIDRCLRSGCEAVQLGTAFLTTHESGAAPAYKRALLNDAWRTTAFTRGFSGRNAQGLRNAFIEHMADKPALPFPYQSTLTGTLRKKAIALDNVEYQSMWAGQRYELCRDVTVRELVAALEEELRAAQTLG